MDLTKQYPRSVHDKVAGVVQIGRTADKAHAHLAETLGEYDYGCPMDKAVLDFLGSTPEQFLEVVKKSPDDKGIEAFVREHISGKTPSQIEQWNADWVQYGPHADSPGYDYFMTLRGKVAPDRTDITSWADLLDLDEKRPVPHRVAA